ncbi:hypothetical protein J6590_015437 [Homalodisca vitripennis]|nr:hypothetical protein J6590_015437 [Homalodisca vitripennis]
MSDTAAINTQSIADYLAQLLKDRKQVTAFPNVFMHVERLIDEESEVFRGEIVRDDNRARKFNQGPEQSLLDEFCAAYHRTARRKSCNNVVR